MNGSEVGKGKHGRHWTTETIFRKLSNLGDLDESSPWQVASSGKTHASIHVNKLYSLSPDENPNG